MIETGFDARVKINQVIENQLPEFLLSESPKSVEFLKQYYISQEYQGGAVDIVENLDEYLKLDNFTSEVIQGKTTLLSSISSLDTNISVVSTKGFPNQYGLFKIDDEIITYTGISGNTFVGCKRGFSGVTSYHKINEPNELEFSTSNANEHVANSTVINLSALFLQEFYKKIKTTFTPGLENSPFISDLNVRNFIKEAKSFYQSKGTEESFRILFNVLYGESPKILDLETLLIKPSSANFKRREVIIAELLNPPANPLNLIGQTIRKSTDSFSQSSVSEVEILNRKGKTYYKLSLFVGYDDQISVQGNFNIQAKTKVLENISIGSSVISVDSTIGFGQTGTLISGFNKINYTDKSVNQFFNCTGVTNFIPATSDIRSDEVIFGYENGNLNNKVELRITGVLSNFVPTSEISLTEENEVISVKNIGEIINNPENNPSRKEIFANSWIYNTSCRFEISEIFGSTFSLLSKIDRSSLKIGDSVDILVRGTENVVVNNALVTNINQTDNQVTLTNIESFIPSPSLDYDVRRKIKKTSSTGVSLEFGNDTIISDVQNLYTDNDNYAYVASNSLPNYIITKNLIQSSIPEATGSPIQSNLGQGFLQGYDTNTLKYSQISFTSNVPFISGDAVVYQSQNQPIPGLISGETYYVQVLELKNKIRLYFSRSFVGTDSYLQFETLNSNTGFHKFILKEQEKQILSPQTILKKFPLNPDLESPLLEETKPGSVGLLVNGVEIISPKSNDKLYYGPLEDIKILNSGKNYDVLNPPKVFISSPQSLTGTQAYANVVVRGSVKKVVVDPQEFDLNGVISATISGGNGSGAILKPIVSKRFREFEFDARTTLDGGGLNLSDETITFNLNHNLQDGEPIVYNSNGNSWLGIGTFGPPDIINNQSQNNTLINGATYYAKIVNTSTIQLYQTKTDYLSGINTVGFTTENNGGIHKFRTLEKQTLRSIKVIQSNVFSKEVVSTVKTGVSTISLESLSGISVGDSIIGNFSISNSGVSTIKSLDFTNNIIEIQDGIVGIITESTQLKIKKENQNEYENRKLYVSPIGISTFDHTVTFKNHNFKNGDLINYGYTGTPISGLSTENSYYVLKLDANKFRLADAGINTITKSNFEKNKFVKFSSIGTDYHIFKYPDIVLDVNVSFGGTITHKLNATSIVRGSIVDIYLYENGTGYGSDNILNLEKLPTISLKNGKNAEVLPVVKNGRITQVDILTGGSEYFSVPDLVVEGKGSGAILRAVIQNEKLIDVIVINSGIGYDVNDTKINVIASGSGASFKSKIRSLTVNNQFRYGNEILSSGREKLKYSWVGYPFNLGQETFGDNSSNHSPIIGWAYDGNPIYGPYGYSDPENNNSEIKLLTPGYVLDALKVFDRPSFFGFGFFIEDFNFMSTGDLDTHNGRFCKTPEFPLGTYAYFVGLSSITFNPIYPYFIGNTYRSPILKENALLNQSFDFNNSSLVRNTFPYKVNDSFANNDFLIESNEIVNQISIIESVSEGSINFIDVIEPGSNYKVGDLVNVDNTDTGGGGLNAIVSSLTGKVVNSIDTQVETYNGAVIEWKDLNSVLIYFEPYHELLDNDNVIISGISTSIKNIEEKYKIGVFTSKTTLFNDVPTNIIPRSVYDLYVSHIPQNISIGSSIKIDDENLKVLNIFPQDSVIRVRRSDVGTSHTISTIINVLPNQFTIPLTTEYFDSKVNQKIYFNPHQSVGVGTTVGGSTNVNYTVGVVTSQIAVPTQTIYIPNHPFKTGQEVKLSKYPTSSSFIVSDIPGGSTFNIPQTGVSTTVYIIKKSKDFIGLTTIVGLTTNTGGLFFTSNGTNDFEYSLETVFPQITANILKVNSTVSVASTHNLKNGDKIQLEVTPNLSVGIGTSTSIKIVYNENIQNLVANPVGFDSSKIDVESNRININSHNLITGDKIFYNSSDIVAAGLSTGKYYVKKVDDDHIQLAETRVDLQSIPQRVINVVGVGGSGHEISLINPQILSIKNNDLVFDLSDSSLVGYNFKFFYDNQFSKEFIGVGNSLTFNISGVGTIGIGSISTITLKYLPDIPSVLYYNLEKSGYISTTDKEVDNYSQILFTNSFYNGTYSVSGVGTTTFNISLNQIPEKLSYSTQECDSIKYTTTSPNVKGGVEKFNIIFGGYNYKKLPKFLNIKSDEGKNAKIKLNSSNIGKINKIRILDQGFEYSSDKTLRPEAQISPYIYIKDSTTVSDVIVNYGGKNYSVAPNLVIKNLSENKIVDTTQSLKANLSSGSVSSVDIIYPIYGLASVEHQLIPINNSNGVGISSVLSSSSGIITCFLSTPPISGFAVAPFSVGDEILVEGIQKYGSEGSGFNSKDYNYEFFIVTGYQNTNPAILEYQVLSNPGTATTIQTAYASIINKKNIPQFTVNQKFESFNNGEQLLTLDGNEFAVRDLYITSSNSDYIKVKGSYTLQIDEVVKGKNSGVLATVEDIISNTGKFNTEYSILQDYGWDLDTGKLNKSYQLISDNDYYQNLSYTIKSTIPFDEIIDPVNRLVHTVGLKNFADVQINSKPSVAYAATSSSNDLIILDIKDEKRVDSINNFDLVVDIDTFENSSKYLSLKNKKLSDYIACKTNRVLIIDDISKQFSSKGLGDNLYSDISLLENSYYNYFVQIKDPNTNQLQVSEIITLSTNNDIFTFEKGTLTNTTDSIGNLSAGIDEFDVKSLRFSPSNPFDIDYDIKTIETTFNSSLVGVNTQSVGFIDLIGINTSVGVGTTGNVITVNKDNFTTLVANIQIINSSNTSMNYIEVFLEHNNTDTFISEYYFDTSEGISTSSFGTFTSSLDSNNFSLNFYNESNQEVLIRSKIVGFGTTSVGIGTYRFKLSGQTDGNERTAFFESNYASSLSPTIIDVVGVSSEIISSVRSLIRVSCGETSAIHQILLLNDTTNLYTLQYPFVSIGNTAGIGTFGGEFSGLNMVLKFYPDPSITGSIQVQSFNTVVYSENDYVNIPPDLTYGPVTDSIILSSYDSINGNRANKTDFALNSQNTPIYSKTFDPSDSNQLNFETGIFTIKDHFFSTGEELVYTPKSTFVGVGTESVGIGSTLTSLGIVTDRLPSNVYAININSDKFRLATRKDYALAGIYVTFTSPGIGNAHQLEMSKKLEKTIISIDGVVQKPITYNPVSFILENNNGQIEDSATYFSISGISSLRPKDLLKIDEEFISIVSVGIGSTSTGPIVGFGTYNLVEGKRGFVGSSATSHSDNTTVQLYRGAFNIVDSKIYFTEPPKGSGNKPINDLSNLPFSYSKFNGRVYLRNDYSTNLLFDDFSEKFTGIGQTYTLSIQGINTTGIETGSGVLFVNDIFQTPTTDNNEGNNYSVVSSAGISSVIFTGISSSNGELILSDFDINQNQLPRGGAIISLGSTPGLGYAPLVSAKVKAIVGSGGSIIDVTGIAFTGTGKNVSTAYYNNNTGIVEITTTSDHELSTGDFVKLIGLGFTCPSTSGVTSYFPLSGLDGSYGVSSVISPSSFRSFVGYSTLPHTYVGMGTVFPWYDLNYGSGYRGPISVGVTDVNHLGTEANISAVVGAGGTLSFIVNSGGSGYTTSTVYINLPDPSYSDLEVIGVSRIGVGNTTETGTNLLVTLDVGASSTTGIGSTLFEVKNFKISRQGYGFKIGDVFKPVGLVTDQNLISPISDFELTVLDTFTDSVSAWQFGELDYIDSVKNLQNGSRIRFPLYYNDQLLSFEKDSNSQIDLSSILLIFINGVIQEPNISYQFDGGTTFTFTEAPKPEDNVSIFFYRGTRGEDSFITSINETMKEGDTVQVYKNDIYDTTITQNIRKINKITSSNIIETNIYTSQGIDEINYKPLTWTKQKVDTIINGDYIYKSRDSIESQIYPTARIIKDLTISDSSIFVDNAKFFNYEEENYGETVNSFDSLIIPSVNLVSAALTATVSAAGTIQSINIVNGGSGYIGTSVVVKISAPKNIKSGIGSIASGIASISNGTISSPLVIINPGLGYTTSSPPQVIVEYPEFLHEKVDDIISVEGFSGIITGISTTSGTSGHPLAIKLFLNANSFTGLQIGYPISVFDTITGAGLTSVDINDSSIVGIGTTFIDNIYYVHDISVFGSNAEVVSNILSSSNTVGIETLSTISEPVGKFSWGRFYNFTRSNPISIGVSGFTVDSGLSTFPIIQRRGYGLRNTGALKKTSNI